MTTINLVDYNGIKVTPDFFAFKEKLERFDVRTDDVWLTSYPKAGSTWSQEMIWLIGNDLNYDAAKTNLYARFPFIDVSFFGGEMNRFIRKHNIPSKLNPEMPRLLEVVRETNGTRYIKTHLPWDLLPRQITEGIVAPKIIHVMRNPKQVVPSYFNHSTKIFPMFVGTLQEFVDLYIKGEIFYGGYFRTVLSYWNERHRSNLLIISYEEMHADLPAVIRKVSDFLGKSCSEEEIKGLAQHLSFDEMKENIAVNAQEFIENNEIHFIRKGRTDSYKEELTPGMISKLDRWVDENIKGTDLPYQNC